MTLKSPWRSIQAYRRRNNALYGGRSYASKVLGYGPIAYWPLWEASGTVAQCLVNSAQNGTYNSDVGTWPVGTGIGDGNTAPFFDGTNDVVDVDSAALFAAFNGAEGSIACWWRVANAGVWTDGQWRTQWYVVTNINNRNILNKSNAADRMISNRIGGGVNLNEIYNGLSSTNWQLFVLTWSEASDLVAYYNHSATPTTDNGLGAWAGNLAIARIGASDLVPNTPWHGWLAHVAIWDRAIPQSTVQDLLVP